MLKYKTLNKLGTVTPLPMNDSPFFLTREGCPCIKALLRTLNFFGYVDILRGVQNLGCINA